MAQNNKLRSLTFKTSKFLKFKFSELQSLIKSAKILDPFSPLIRFWFVNLFLYSLVYPALRLALKKDTAVKACEYFIKPPLSPKAFSFPSLMKSKIILKTNQDWSILIETHLRDVYHKNILKEGMTILDIGSHIGIYAILAAEKTGGTGKVIAVEPELKNYENLLANINLNNFKNIIPVKIGLSDHNGLEKLFINSCSTSHSLLPERSNTSSFKEIQVKTLDKLLEELNIKKIDAIKIDAEGSEMAILEGAKKILENNPSAKIIVASYHYPDEAKEVMDFLKKIGFKPELFIANIVIA